MNHQQPTILADRRYTAEHVWMLEQGRECVLGISDFAQDQLGEVQFVDLPGPGERFSAGGGFGSVESVKSVNTLYMPVSGRVIEVNSALEESPALVNADCYGAGWLIRIEADEAEAEGLMEAESYRAFLAK